jgi:hypothetical protein
MPDNNRPASDRRAHSSLLSAEPAAEAELLDKLYASIDDVRFSMHQDIEQCKVQDDTSTKHAIDNLLSCAPQRKADGKTSDSSPPSAKGGSDGGSKPLGSNELEDSTSIHSIQGLADFNGESQKVLSELRTFMVELPAATNLLRAEAEKEIARVREASTQMLNKLTEESLPAACQLLKAEVQTSLSELRSMTSNTSTPQPSEAIRLETETCLRHLKGTIIECQDAFRSEMHKFEDAYLAQWRADAERMTSEMRELLAETKKTKMEPMLTQSSTTASLESYDSISLQSVEDRLKTRISALESEVKSQLQCIANATANKASVEELRASCLKEGQSREQLFTTLHEEFLSSQASLEARIKVVNEKNVEDIGVVNRILGEFRQEFDVEKATHMAAIARIEDTMDNNTARLQKRIVSLQQLISYGGRSVVNMDVSTEAEL